MVFIEREKRIRESNGRCKLRHREKEAADCEIKR
jgi:hypothetical protein